MRYQRRISLGKHLKLNVSKSGISTSFKLFGFTINPQRNRVTYNTPIKGLSLTGKLYDEKINKVKTELDRLYKVLIKQLTDCTTDIQSFINACNECEVEDYRIYIKAEQIKEGFKCNINKLNANDFSELKAENKFYIRTLNELRDLCKADQYHFGDESIYRMVKIQTNTFKGVGDYIDLLEKYMAK